MSQSGKKNPKCLTSIDPNNQYRKRKEVTADGQIKVSCREISAAAFEAMTFRAYGQGRNQKLFTNIRPAHQMPEARKSVTDNGNAGR